MPEIHTAPALSILGQYFREIRRYRIYSLDEELDIGRELAAERRHIKARLGRNGNGGPGLVGKPKTYLDLLPATEAHQALFCANLRFVVNRAKKFSNLGLPLEEVIALGNKGLCDGVSRFDYKKGCKVITYAGWWIRQAILFGAPQQTYPLRITQQVHMRLAALRDGEASLQDRQPHIRRRYERLIHMTESSPLDIADEAAVPQLPIAEPRATSLDRLEADQVRSLLEDAIRFLPARELAILRAYYGLETGHPQTLQVVGLQFGITRERVRQIKLRSLKRIQERHRAADAALLRLSEYADWQPTGDGP